MPRLRAEVHVTLGPAPALAGEVSLLRPPTQACRAVRFTHVSNTPLTHFSPALFSLSRCRDGQATGHSAVQERLGHALVHDAQQAPRLMLTNGAAPPTTYEATLQFDGAAVPTPGCGGAGWYLVDDRHRVLSEDGESVR